MKMQKGQSEPAAGSQSSGTRRYRKTTRAESERATGEAILAAAFTAFSTQRFDRVSLKSIAEQSGVTVQTVIRRFGSKEELFEALVKRETPRIIESRDVPNEAGLAAALAALIEHYERDGDTVLNFLSQEDLFEPIRRIVETGRRVHRRWVERYCGEILAGTNGERRERLVNAAIAATDLSTWRLLRRDLGLSKDRVLSVMTELLQGLNRRT